MAEDPEHGVLYLSIATLFGAYLSVRIRLKRFGKIRAPFYRIVVADSRTKRDGRVIEEIGKYHPTRDPSYIDVNSERAQYWLSKERSLLTLCLRYSNLQVTGVNSRALGLPPRR